MSFLGRAATPKTDDKKAFVRRMFDDIHGRYDLLNSILSFGQDKRWRKITVTDLPSKGILIDLCSGGGELAQALFARGEFTGAIVLADISKQMISLCRHLLESDYGGRYFPVVCDAENLPFKGGAFAGAMSAFSLRNLTDLPRFSGEVRRVLQPDGRARFLEIAHPRNKLWGAFFEFYFYYLSPLMASLFTKKTYAYRYLPRSLKTFPSQAEVVRVLGDGWAGADHKNIMGGIAAVYRLIKDYNENA